MKAYQWFLYLPPSPMTQYSFFLKCGQYIGQISLCQNSFIPYLGEQGGVDKNQTLLRASIF